MTTTTYYNLNIVEGTDIVNPLIVDNPNYEKIDETMHDNAVAGVTLATEIANATVHAITRENSDCAVIRFIATSQWKAGDTATVDGVPVTALLPSGETLPDGAYVINANVLCILTGTNLTVYAERKKAENANEIAYNDTTVGAEIDRLNASLQETNSDLKSLIAEISVTLPDSDSLSVDYPAGYTFDNTVVICAYATNSANLKYLFPYMASTHSSNSIYLSYNKINIVNNVSAFYGYTLYLYLMKK